MRYFFPFLGDIDEQQESRRLDRIQVDLDRAYDEQLARMLGVDPDDLHDALRLPDPPARDGGPQR